MIKKEDIVFAGKILKEPREKAIKYLMSKEFDRLKSLEIYFDIEAEKHPNSLVEAKIEIPYFKEVSRIYPINHLLAQLTPQEFDRFYENFSDSKAFLENIIIKRSILYLLINNLELLNHLIDNYSKFLIPNYDTSFILNKESSERQLLDFYISVADLDSFEVFKKYLKKIKRFKTDIISKRLVYYGRLDLIESLLKEKKKPVYRGLLLGLGNFLNDTYVADLSVESISRLEKLALMLLNVEIKNPESFFSEKTYYSLPKYLSRFFFRRKYTEKSKDTIEYLENSNLFGLFFKLFEKYEPKEGIFFSEVASRFCAKNDNNFKFFVEKTKELDRTQILLLNNNNIFDLKTTNASYVLKVVALSSDYFNLKIDLSKENFEQILNKLDSEASSISQENDQRLYIRALSVILRQYPSYSSIKKGKLSENLKQQALKFLVKRRKRRI